MVVQRLAGKRVLVTGGGSGVGAAIALRLAEDGARVAVLDIDAGAARASSDAIVAAGGGEAVAVVADVSREASIATGVGAAVERLGGLDVVVPNAALQLFGQDTRVHELDVEVWERTVAVNLRGAFLTCKHAVPHLVGAGGGSVVVVGSPTGLFGVAPGFTAYSASKAGLLGLVRVMAVDYAADGVRANLVVPGFTATPLVRSILDDPDRLAATLRAVPLGRPGTAAEIGGLVAYLASADASYATGGVFTVDGGMTAI